MTGLLWHILGDFSRGREGRKEKFRKGGPVSGLFFLPDAVVLAPPPLQPRLRVFRLPPYRAQKWRSLTAERTEFTEDARQSTRERVHRRRRMAGALGPLDNMQYNAYY
jgi:hypothetical protein